MNIAASTVTNARVARLRLVTEIMEMEYSFNDMRKMRGRSPVSRNSNEEEVEMERKLSRVPNKWLRIVPDNSLPPVGCFFGNVNHSSDVIKEAGFAHLEMKF